jgi:hypothetical protein
MGFMLFLFPARTNVSAEIADTSGDRQRISGELRQKFMSVPVPYMIRGELAAKFSHMRREFIYMPGSDGAG